MILNMTISHNLQVRSLQIFNHLLGIFGLWYAWQYNNENLIFLSFVTYWVTGILGINIGFHRLISHRSFVTSNIIEKILSLIGVITTVGSPLAWAAIHRQHHRCTDRIGDPHSPLELGNFKAWFGLWNNVRLDLKLIKDLRSKPFYRKIHKYYFYIILFYCIGLSLIDPIYVIFIYCIPACLCLHSTSSIIVIAHRHGYRPYPDVKDQSRNSWIANLITLGEGWHNTHHAKPYAWNNQEHWWEFDIPAYIIRFIKR